MEENTMISNRDHDLLIELRTEMQNVRRDIKELNDGTAGRIRDLQANKADRKEVEANRIDRKEIEDIQDKLNKDIETRVRSLEAAKSFYMTSMIIYTAVGVFMIGLIIYHILGS